MAQWSCNTGRQPSNGLKATLTGFQLNKQLAFLTYWLACLSLFINVLTFFFFLPIIQKDELLIFSSYKEWNHFLLQLVAMEIVFHNWTSIGTRCKNNLENLLFLRISCWKVVDNFLGTCPRLESPWNGTSNFQWYVSLLVFMAAQVIMTGICPSPIKHTRLHLQINVWFWHSLKLKLYVHIKKNKPTKPNH